MILLPEGCKDFFGAEGVVCFPKLWVDTTELTIERYRSLMGMNPSRYHPDNMHACPTCPVENLTYYEAILAANARTKAELLPQDTVYTYSAVVTTTNTGFLAVYKPQEVTNLVGLVADTGKAGFRLPTYAEWMYAALQSDKDSYPWEKIEDPAVVYKTHIVMKYAWIDAVSGDTTHPVAQLIPNEWFLYDVISNASEWTSIRHADEPTTFTAMGGDAFGMWGVPFDLRWDLLRGGVRYFRRSGESTASITGRPCR